MNSGDPLLVLDATTPTTQIGLLVKGNWIAFFSDGDSKALHAIFSGIRTCLQRARMELAEVGAFCYCQGPGSVLGLRLTVMTLTGWRSQPPANQIPLFAYNSLFASMELLKQRGITPPFRVAAPIRGDRWFTARANDQGRQYQPIIRSRRQLEAMSDPLWVLPQRKWGSTRIEGANTIDYDLRKLAPATFGSDLLRPVEEPELLTPEEAQYRKWTRQRHR